MLSPPQFYNSTQREEYSLKGYTAVSSVPCHFWDLCSLLAPQMSLPSVAVGSDCFVRHRDRPYAKSKVHASGQHGAFLPSLVFQQHLEYQQQNKTKRPNVYVDSPSNLPGVWLILKYTNR